MPKFPKLKTLAALLSASLMTGCGTSTFGTDVSCKVFKPINASVRDTIQTKRQVIGHNKAFDAICKG